MTSIANREGGEIRPPFLLAAPRTIGPARFYEQIVNFVTFL
jgi:hypothetical protein